MYDGPLSSLPLQRGSPSLLGLPLRRPCPPPKGRGALQDYGEATINRAFRQNGCLPHPQPSSSRSASPCVIWLPCDCNSRADSPYFLNISPRPSSTCDYSSQELLSVGALCIHQPNRLAPGLCPGVIETKEDFGTNVILVNVVWLDLDDCVV